MGYPTKFTINCPFYEFESEKSIVCEGLEGAIKNKMVFSDEKTKIEHVKKNCTCPMPEYCSLFKLLTQKYVPEEAEVD